MLGQKARPNLSDKDVRGLEDAARAVVEIHHALAGWMRVGMTVAQIDEEVARLLKSLGATSCFHRYKAGRYPPFPSQACLSVNDCIVHGTAWTHKAPLAPGDLLKIDIGVRKNNWIGDAAWTYSFGAPADDVARLMTCGKTSLARGIQALQPGDKLLEWARTVQGHVEQECGFHLVIGLGGHGYGRRLHADPWVSNVLPTVKTPWPDAHKRCTPGMALAVEPMIAIGTGKTKETPGDWPIRTADGSMAVHYEADVLITEDGPRDLTQGLSDVNDVIDK